MVQKFRQDILLIRFLMISKPKPKSEFSKNVLTLMTGSTIAQAIPVLISPILTRIYTPEEFGVFALYMSIIPILAIISTGKYELAIMIPKKDSYAINLVALSLLLTVLFSIIFMLLIVVFNTEFTNLLNNKDISKWLYIVPISVLFVGTYQVLRYWNNRNKKYKNIAYSTISQSGTTATSNILLGINNMQTSGLIISSLLGQIIAVFILLKVSLKDNILLKVNKLRMIAIGKKYKKFPLYFTFSAGINSLASSLIIIALAISFDPLLAGSYFLVVRAIRTPISIISNAIGNVFFEKVSKSRGDCSKLYIKTSMILFLIGIIPTILIFLYSSELFILIFGEQWETAGRFAEVLVIMFFISFFTIPVSQLSFLEQKARYNILWQITLIIGTLIGWYYGVLYNEVYVFIIIYAITQSLLYIFGFYYEYKLCKERK
jgi:O-antigen/teichoic acid export membrane protein